MSSPIIFEKGTRDFSTLGLGLLSDAIQATTTEELNGQFIFEMDYPVSGNNADLIKENRIIVVNSGHILKRQGFIIRQIVRKIDLKMTVYAEHVSYATLDVALAPIGTISGDAKTALENWKRMLVPAVDFTVDSDILTTNSTSIGAPEFETARQGLGGHAGSILDVWGGEYQFDNWHIRLLKQRGKSANAIIAYGRNLISFEQDTNIADTYTSVYPYYQENSGDEGNKNHFLPDRTVDSEFVGKYPNPKVLMLDLSNKFKDVADYSETKLRNYALSYIKSNSIGVPKVNMKISTVDLSRATGGFSEDIDLGDTVNVYFEKLGITTSAKVIKAVWNVLSDDYDKFEIGARRSSLTESISELATTADENANKALNQALVAQQSADGKTTIYYLDSSDPWPTNPKENDTAFVKDGENSIMYRYMFNNDTGVFSWVKILDSMSADQIKQRVSDALESGKAHTDEVKQSLSSDIATAKSQAASQASTAEANAKSAATSQFTQAQNALSAAKTELTNSIASEASERAKAVAAANSQANNAINQAKSDINDTIKALSVGGRNYFITSNAVSGYINTDGTVHATSQTNADMMSDFIAVSPNDTWQLTGWGASGIAGNVVYAYYDSNKAFVTGSRVSTSFPATTPSITIPITIPSGVAYIRVSSQHMGNSQGTKVKVEKGTKPTDWTSAPEDVVYDYTNKDNQIKQTFTQYKDTNDGKVSKAQTTAQAALDGLALKVSKTDYDQKTGDLSTKINNVKETADSSAQTIADIKTADGKQDARISEVEKTAGEIKSTVSDLSTAQGKQSGYISELQQSAKGFEGSIREINNAVNGLGQTNQLFNTEFTPDFQGWSADTGYELSSGLPTYDGSNVVHIKTTSTGYDYLRQSVPVAPGQVISFSTMMKFAPTSPDNSTVYWRYSINFYRASGGRSLAITYGKQNYQVLDWTLQKSENIVAPADAAYMNVTYYLRGAGEAWLSKPMLVFESTVGTYIQGNYNNNDALAKIKLTADQASLDLSKYQTDADGRISKAQTDIVANANAITQKVSQTDYDKKTGDLTTAVSKAQTTADGVVTTVGNYQTSNDKRVKAAESAISQNADNIALKVAKTDYDNNNSQLNTRFTKVEATANGTATTVSDLQQTVNNLGQVNQLFNTEFSPDFSGWILTQTRGSIYVKKTASYNGSNVVEMATNTGKGIANTGSAWLVSPEFAVQKGIPLSFAVSAKVISKPTDATTSFFLAQLRFTYSDGTVSYSGDIIRIKATDTISPDFVRDSLVNVTIPDNVVSVCYYSWIRGEGTVVQVSQPMGVFEKTVGAYVQGNYNNSADLAQVKITADNISNFVKDANGNISSTFQTALSKTSIITGSTLATSIKTQTATQISSALTDNNGKIISLINQDSSGVQIAGKNIVLNGDTTVTGDFYAKGGNFKNINASNITVGNLDADEVRIINLDVNTLTGNVSRFLETNWDGAYGSTKITSTGMKINTQYIQADFQGFGMDFSYSNKKIGGMGISQYLNGEPGLSMRLESEGAYMAWSARNEGNSTGPYIDKLAWYRQGKPALGGNYGFIFSDRVTFNKPINVEGASINLGFRPINLYGNNFPFFGNQDNITGFAYTSNEIYMVLQNQYVNLSKVIKALSGLGSWLVPINIDSTGKVTKWFNVTT